MTGSVRLLATISVATVISGCATGLYQWGDYEDSLHRRYTDPSAAGQERAFAMIQETIQDLERKAQQVPPGLYADFGYLLYRQNRLQEAIAYFRKEASTYPEATLLMESVISRIEKKAQQQQ